MGTIFAIVILTARRGIVGEILAARTVNAAIAIEPEPEPAPLEAV
jgi:hypothetical protein